jgi:hypothetical protein
MKNKILITIPYKNYIEIDAEILEKLIECRQFTYDGWQDDTCVYQQNYSPLEIRIVESSRLENNQEIIDINHIMEENNKLTREIEFLKEKSKKSGSKEIIV